MPETSLAKDRMKIVLLEGVHSSAAEALAADGYTNIEYYEKALPEPKLIEAVRDAFMVGIRSATQLTEAVFDASRHLIATGCFCIGTNQVDLTAARHRGICVFNAPFTNTRSVAELVLAEIVALAAAFRRATWSCIAANGRSRPSALARSAARRWASSATATSARRSACWRILWA